MLFKQEGHCRESMRPRRAKRRSGRAMYYIYIYIYIYTHIRTYIYYLLTDLLICDYSLATRRAKRGSGRACRRRPARSCPGSAAPFLRDKFVCYFVCLFVSCFSYINLFFKVLRSACFSPCFAQAHRLEEKQLACSIRSLENHAAR